jgi:HAD superfamily hydrolase (TIGR01549 family)
MIKAIILDFDGVILESCAIKTRAFRELFKNYPEHLDAIIDYHLNHAGVSRYKKFIYFYKNILKKPVSDEKLAELGESFSQQVLEEVNRCNYVPGAREFLKLYSKKLHLYLASGTPENELRAIIKERGLESYFRGVYGTPATKSEIINKILKKENLKKDQVFFVGDSKTDYEEAINARIPFVTRISESTNFKPESKFCKAIIKDLNGLIKFLSK